MFQWFVKKDTYSAMHVYINSLFYLTIRLPVQWNILGMVLCVSSLVLKFDVETRPTYDYANLTKYHFFVILRDRLPLT